MKNTTKKKVISVLSTGLKITAVGAAGLALMGCPPEQIEQQPVEQSKDITLAAGKKVTVNFTALPGATPTWWGKLSSQLQVFGAGFPTGNYTLNVTPNGTGGFVAGATGSKTATVGENWLSNAQDTDIGSSIASVLMAWVAQIKNQNRVRFGGGMSAFELAQVKKHGYVRS